MIFNLVMSVVCVLGVAGYPIDIVGLVEYYVVEIAEIDFVGKCISKGKFDTQLDKCRVNIAIPLQNSETNVKNFDLPTISGLHTENNEALRLASGNGHLSMVKYLVSMGADIHAESNEALRLASGNGHLSMVQYLVSMGADIHAKNNEALRLASGNGHLSMVQYLVSMGADIHAKNNEVL